MLPPLNRICHYKLRRDIKSDHGIDQGGCIRDALAVTFCFCCALIQVCRQGQKRVYLRLFTARILIVGQYSQPLGQTSIR